MNHSQQDATHYLDFPPVCRKLSLAARRYIELYSLKLTLPMPVQFCTSWIVKFRQMKFAANITSITVGATCAAITVARRICGCSFWHPIIAIHWTHAWNHVALADANLTTPTKIPKTPQLVPVDVAFAVYAMWASLLLSTGFAVCEMVASSSTLDPSIRFVMLVADFVVIKALPLKLRWARYGAVILAVIFYMFLAFDADGLTKNDLWHLLAKSPIDIFVISRLFRCSTTKWLSEP